RLTRPRGEGKQSPHVSMTRPARPTLGIIPPPGCTCAPRRGRWPRGGRGLPARRAARPARAPPPAGPAAGRRGLPTPRSGTARASIPSIRIDPGACAAPRVDPNTERLMRRLLLPPALAALVCLAGPARPADPTVTDKLNKKIDFTLQDAAGKPFALSALNDPR